MRLQKLIHSQDDLMTEDGQNAIVVHGVNEITLGGEYTICGRAIPDTTLKYDGWERVGSSFIGPIARCECKDCMRTIVYFKKLH